MDDDGADYAQVNVNTWNTSLTLCFHMTRWWLHSNPKLLSAYVRVDYLLSPHPVVIEHAKKNRNPKDGKADGHLLEKLIVPSLRLMTSR